MTTAEQGIYQPNLVVKTSPVANGAAVSDAITLDGLCPLKLQIPTPFTSTKINFSGSVDGGATFVPIHVNGTLYSLTVAANSINYLEPKYFVGCEQIKVNTGSNENGARTLTISLGPVLATRPQ